MPRAHVNNDLRGLFKVLINTDTKEVLGATLLGAQSQEYINLIKMAIDNHIPYTYLKIKSSPIPQWQKTSMMSSISNSHIQKSVEHLNLSSQWYTLIHPHSVEHNQSF